MSHTKPSRVAIKTEAIVRAASYMAVKEARTSRVNEIIRQLKSSQAYKDAGEILPADRKDDTVQGIIAKLPAYILEDLRASNNLHGETEILAAVNEKLNPPVKVNQPVAESVILNVTGPGIA